MKKSIFFLGYILNGGRGAVLMIVTLTLEKTGTHCLPCVFISGWPIHDSYPEVTKKVPCWVFFDSYQLDRTLHVVTPGRLCTSAVLTHALSVRGGNSVEVLQSISVEPMFNNLSPQCN